MPEIKVDSTANTCPADIKVNCINETCPVPLVETRKALRNAADGDIIEVTGTHPASKKEIPMAVKALGYKLIGIEESGNTWKIRIRKEKEAK